MRAYSGRLLSIAFHLLRMLVFFFAGACACGGASGAAYVSLGGAAVGCAVGMAELGLDDAWGGADDAMGVVMLKA